MSVLLVAAELDAQRTWPVLISVDLAMEACFALVFPSLGGSVEMSLWPPIARRQPLPSMAGECPPSGATQMGILSWIILGLIAGFIRGKIVNRQGQGFWLDIGLGIIGAIVGGYLFSLFGKEGVTGLNLYSMLVAVAGSVVVLLIYNAITGRRPACSDCDVPAIAEPVLIAGRHNDRLEVSYHEIPDRTRGNRTPNGLDVRRRCQGMH
jgi:uncharacterized membrane protein YeaQ/YmgE (transglycosylase-associated protein family)